MRLLLYLIIFAIYVSSITQDPLGFILNIDPIYLYDSLKVASMRFHHPENFPPIHYFNTFYPFIYL
jgi:hypothetical protein